MGNNSSTASQKNDCCGICQTNAASRPGIALLSPGCCGQWYHQDCLQNYVSNNPNQINCPKCNQILPDYILNMATVTIHNAQPVQAQAIFQTPIAQAVPQQQLPNNALVQPLPAPQMNNNNKAPRPNQLPADQTSNTCLRQLPKFQEEQYVDEWRPPLQSTSTEKSTESTGGNIHVECKPEMPQISIDARDAFYAVASLYADSDITNVEDVDSVVKPPMDIVCVLDTSGSMGSDNKLVNLKYAVDYVRSELGDGDRMGVVTFETEALLIHHLTRMTESNKAAVSPMISNLRPGGGTTILCGLEYAYTLLQGRQSKNPITSVFLLTDGIDDSNLQEKRSVARKLKEMGCSLFVFGFGADHDSAHLKAIAEAGEGIFSYIEKSDNVIDAFGGALGSEKSIVAVNLSLVLTAQPGVKFTNIQSGFYRNNISSDKKTATISYNNLMKGEQRDVLVTTSIDGSEIETDGYALFNTSVTYSSIGGSAGQQLTVSGDSCFVSRLGSDKVNPNQQRHVDVDVQVNRMMLAKVTEESLAEADAGNLEQARKKVTTALDSIKNSSSAQQNHKTTVGMEKELEDTLAGLQSRDAYVSRGGRSKMSEMNQTISCQRSVFSKNEDACLYQNTWSTAYQSKAKTKKASYFGSS